MPTPIEETQNDWASHIFPSSPNLNGLNEAVDMLVEEATRRGIEQGKREAWEGIKKILETCPPFSRMEFSKEEFGEYIVGKHIDGYFVSQELINTFSSLSNPQKEV